MGALTRKIDRAHASGEAKTLSIRRSLAVLVGLAGVGLVAIADWRTGTEISLSIFYVLPIGLTVWIFGKFPGIVVAVIAAGVWLLVDLHGGAVYSRAFIPYWNGLVRLGFFLLTTVLLHRIRFLTDNLEALVRERLADLVAEVERRKRVEDILRESEERFHQLTENIKEVFWISDPNRDRVLYVSPAFEEIWGRPCDSLYQSPHYWLETIHSDERERVRKAAQAKQLSKGYEETYRIVRPDGSFRWIQDRAFPVRDASGGIHRLVGIAEDITVRKQAETQSSVFAALGHKLSAAARQDTAAEIILDMSSELFGWDAGYLHLYSVADDRIVPVRTVDTIDGKRTIVPSASFPHDPSPLMRRIMQTGPQLINRPESPFPDAVLVPFGETGRRSASMMYVPIASGQTVLGVLSIQSYTPQAYSPADLSLLEILAGHCGDALRRIKLTTITRELASIVENSADAIISNTLDGRILSWNSGAERLYGYTAAEVIGRSISLLIPPEIPDEWASISRSLSRGARIDDLETSRLRRDGTRVQVSLAVSPTRDEAGAITGVSVIARDITERKRLEREIAEISHQEQESIAHELHDLLGAYLAGVAFRAKSLAERLEERSLPEADDARHLVSMVNESSDQVRNFARMLAPVEVGTGGLPAALSRWGAEVETFFGITCFVDVARDLPPLTDEQGRQLYRIAQEAARNAVKHANAQVIEISLLCREGHLELIVRNDGTRWQSGNLSSGLGLRIMRYRAGILGGVLAIGPDERDRITLRCQVPLAAALSNSS